MAVYDRDDAVRSLAQAEALIDSYRDAAVTPDSDEIVVELTGVIDDPFAV
jgi:hypothetical protein